MKKKVLKRVLFGLLFSVAILILSAILFLSVYYNKSKLDIDRLTNFNSGVKLYSANYMTEDENCFYNLNRKLVNINDLNEHTVNAFVAIEDKRFYSHNGYDLKRIAKSALVNLKNNSKSQGASTITQQLVKNTLLSSEKTYERKLNEVMLAIKVEKEFSKEEILNMYLNTIYFGSNAYGIENASQIYFNKSASELTLNESAILAGLIKSPRTYSPKLNKKNCFERKNLVLKQMLNNGFISKEEYDQTIILDVECSSYENSYDNSYYQQAILEACELLSITEKELIRNNYQIITYLNTDLQNEIKSIYETLNYVADKLSIIANSNGEIISYIGSSNYDLSNMNRSPASTLKPFAVYLPSIEHNILHSSTPILDEEIDYNGYSPKNFNNKFAGWISAKEALSSSLNVPAVKVLNCLGTTKSIAFLKTLGLNLDEQDNNLALALGSLTNGVSPIQLLELYTIFQNYGYKTKLKFVDKILDEQGRIIYQSDKTTQKVCEESSAYIVTDMLKETCKTGTAKVLGALNFDVASKTGTNSVNGNVIDLYNIAFTSELLTFTWLGDAENLGLELTSSYEASKLNKRILESFYKNSSPKNFDKPENVIEKDIDLLELNLNHRVVLANSDTPERYKTKALFKADNLPALDNTVYQSPNLTFDLEITNNGVNIAFNNNELYNFKILKIVNGIETLSPTLNDGDFSDGRVFCYDKISYQLIAEHKYNKTTYYGETKDIYPKEYLISNLKNQHVVYDLSNKKRWYV